MRQSVQYIFDFTLSHTRRSDASEKKERKIAWTLWPNSPVDKFQVLACIDYLGILICVTYLGYFLYKKLRKIIKITFFLFLAKELPSKKYKILSRSPLLR